jgi:dTDP-4-amino-4,6-dideoxygalactose transaminase
MSLISQSKMLAAGAVKKALTSANINPSFVKALVKAPPPVHGGPKARRFPWPARRHFGPREKAAVVRLMDREISRGGAIVYNGPEKAAYCAAFAEYLGGGFVEAVNSGTNAVYVALRALDLEPGSEVITPPITDQGGAMPVAMMNCIPVPADSAPGELNTSAEEIAKVISDRTAAIVVAHISGHPVDMDPILALAAERGIPVVEDCAQAHGATYKGRMVGTLGDIAAFSTMFGKHHSTGAQGGAVFTRDTMLFARVRQITDRGKPYGAVTSAGNTIASLNFNQDEISLAIGRVQLERLPEFLVKRRAFVAEVAERVKQVRGVDLMGPPAGAQGAYWFLLFRLDHDKVGCSAEQFGMALAAEGVEGVYGGYPFFPTDHPWHREAIVYGAGGLPWSLNQEAPRIYELPNAHAANRRMVRVDVHERLGPREARQLATAVGKIARHYAIA